MATERGERAHQHFLAVQAEIVSTLEALDTAHSFITDDWSREAGGGGRTCVLEDGAFIEKGGVNVSCVHGEMSEEFAAQVPDVSNSPAAPQPWPLGR